MLFQSCFSWRSLCNLVLFTINSPGFVCVHSYVQSGMVEYIINRYYNCSFLNSNKLQADLLFQLNITLRPTEMQKNDYSTIIAAYHSH